EQDGTSVSLLAGKVEEGPSILRGLLNRVGSKIFLSTVEDGLDAFSELIEAETTESGHLEGKTTEILADQIEQALSQSLAQV
ncbi:MAG: hypothetical protein JJE12_15500, partial [Anaerolineales bacterium]|nr:hypothetical protein [Anaerolineales bacterium]